MQAQGVQQSEVILLSRGNTGHILALEAAIIYKTGSVRKKEPQSGGETLEEGTPEFLVRL